MAIKFIVTKDNVYFGDEWMHHRHIAERENVFSKVLGGGYADPDRKWVDGSSTTFPFQHPENGRRMDFRDFYEEIVLPLLPGWKIPTFDESMNSDWDTSW